MRIQGCPQISARLLGHRRAEQLNGAEHVCSMVSNEMQVDAWAALNAYGCSCLDVTAITLFTHVDDAVCRSNQGFRRKPSLHDAAPIPAVQISIVITAP